MRSIPRLAATLLLVLLSLPALASPAGAHTGFESSDPPDGSSVADPVEMVTITFTGEAEPTGSGFQLLEANGELREPVEATSEDGSTWKLRFDPAVAGGTVGVRWSVQAPDAHPISGSFSFTVTAPVGELDDPAHTGTESPGDGTVSTGEVEDLEEDLARLSGEESTAAAERLGALGRTIILAGTLGGVGGLVFAATALRGTRRDVRLVMHWVRRCGVLVLAGSVVELTAQLALVGGGWSGVWSPGTFGSVIGSSFGAAIGLRLLGGTALLIGARLDIAPAAEVRDPLAAITDRVRVGAGGDSDRTGGRHGPEQVPSEEMAPSRGDHAWRPTAESVAALLGAAALLAAYLFDGHTVTEGPRPVTAVVDVLHVTGAAVWAGGIAMLVVVLRRRHRDRRPGRPVLLALRFSVVATFAIVVVGVAGVVLAVLILDSPSHLWSTQWGRLLMAKTTLVVAAAGAGAYNHRVLIPEMVREPASERLTSRFRQVVTAEAAALLMVLVLTALLMGAAS